MRGRKPTLQECLEVARDSARQLVAESLLLPQCATEQTRCETGAALYDAWMQARESGRPRRT
jgi:hypothetical protein